MNVTKFPFRFLFKEDNGVETPAFGMPRPRQN